MQLKRLVDKMASGSGTRADIDTIKRISQTMQMTSLCGLGQAVPTPVLTLLDYFEQEFLDHIDQDKCATNHCPVSVEEVFA